MQDYRIKKIVIVGGGSAGWMCAAALSRVLGGQDCNISLVESDEIGTVGVGEATIPPMASFNEILGVAENEFMQATQGTFKLGIEFVNWGSLGHSYIHPFGNFGADIDSLPFHQYWIKGHQRGVIPDLSTFSLAAVASLKNRFTKPVSIKNSPLAEIAYAYHFDAGLYAKYLRNYAEARGVHRIEGKIGRANLNSDTGFIESVVLQNGHVIEGEFFIDCSGFRGLLIEEALKTGYHDWTNFLPCDRAVAVPCERTEPLLPYTRSTAHSAGWQWRIPLQHRTGNGHVFCSQYMSEDEATHILLSNLDGAPTAEPRTLKFVTGKRKKFWNKNCVALGLSSGFMEPLESTSLHLIQTGISKLINLFPDKRFDKVNEDKYNEQSHDEFDRIRNFIILHYWATDREDSEFWRYCKNMDIPDTLREKVELYTSGGRIFRDNLELFNIPSWLAVMHGQGIRAQGYHPVVDSMPDEELKRRLTSIQSAVAHSAEHMPDHADFIRKYCPAN